MEVVVEVVEDANPPGGQTSGSTGTANTGGGGGGGSNCSPSGRIKGGAGGSGIVIVKELDKASGVWSMSEQLEAVNEDGTWPARVVAIDYMVVAGGGGGGTDGGGGGGAGGYRASGYGPSPLQGSVH